MLRLLSLLCLFLTVGWLLPRGLWGVVPVALGLLMVVTGLGSVIASSSEPGPSGLGGVAVAFLGICVTIIGLLMGGQGDLAQRVLNLCGSISVESALVGGFIIGLVLSIVRLVAKK